MEPQAPDGTVARQIQIVRETIGGIKPADYYSPLNPLTPFTPELAGRMWDFWVGYNLNILPRDRHRYRFQDLRAFSNASDLVRLLIETRKDQVEAMPWNIKPREGKTVAQKKLDAITDFFQYPDRQHTWHQWMRMILEDMFVLDAAYIYPWRNRGGQLLSLDLIDGAMITLKIDSQGRMPDAPSVAFQQIIQGTPAVDYSQDELINIVHNPRTNSPYGFSHVEQIVTTLQIMNRRQETQQLYFDAGTLPLASMEMPKDGVTEEQFKNYMTALNARLEGNIREKVKIVPVLSGSKITEVKQPPLVGNEEEWFARIACYAFKASPQPFVSMMNRSTAESAKKQSAEEGLGPTLMVVKHLIDRIIRDEFGEPDAELGWVDDREQDPLTQMQVDTGYVKAGIRSINEVRSTLGADPVPDELYDMPMPLTMAGYTPLELSATEPEPQDETDPDKPHGEKQEGQSPTAKAGYTRLRKKVTKYKPNKPDTSAQQAVLKKKSVKYLNARHLP